MPTLASLTLHVGASTSALSAGLRSASRSVSSFASRASGRMASFARSMGSHGRSAGSRLMSAMGTAISSTASGIGSVLQASAKPGLIVAALSLAAAVVGAFGAGLIMALSGVAVVGLSAYILKDVPKVKKAMTGMMDTAKKIVKSAAKPMIEPLTEMFGDLEKTVRELSPTIRQMFKVIADSGITKNLSRGLNRMLTPMLDGFTDMLEKSQPVFDAFEDLLASIGEGLGMFFRNLTAFGTEDAARGIRDLGIALKYVFAYIGLFLAAMSKYYVAVRTFIGAAIKFFVSLYNGAATWVPKAVNTVITWFAKLPGRVGGFMSAVWSAVSGFFVRIYNAVTGWVTRTVMSVVRWFGRLPGRVGGALAGLAGAILAKINAARNRMFSAVRGALSRVVSFFASLPGRAGRALAGLAGAITSRARSAGSRMVSAVRDKISSAVSAVRGIPGRAKRALGSLGSVLWDAGASLISGFIDGIKAKIPSVEGVLGGLTSSLTSWKGPERLDKRILTPSGEWVMDGFLRGIESRVASVRSTLGGVTAGLPDMTASATARIDSAVRMVAPARDDRIVLDVDGTDEDLKRLIRRMVKLDGGGDVQGTFGS